MAAMMYPAIYSCVKCGKEYEAWHFGNLRDLADLHCTADFCHACFAEAKGRSTDIEHSQGTK